MRLSLLFLMMLLFGAFVWGCKKHVTKPDQIPVYSWVEEFDTLQSALDKGWVIINNSRPLGTKSWAQGSFVFANGKITGFPASSYKYSGNDYVTCGFNSGAGVGVLSAWLITPGTMVKNGDELIFHTRTSLEPATYADRMEVRFNPADDDIEVGNGPLIDSTVALNTGKFDKILLQINPNLELSGDNAYPGEWKQFTITVTNLPKPGYHRFAFRYFVSDGGPGGINSNGVGLDSVAFVSK